ncbi:MAG: hypothetical protein ACYTJ0_21560, partial [Planctomycetota bacterium]
MTQTECLEQGGSYQGNFTSCEPNPCPQPKGACCLEDGTCSVITQAACTELGGTFQGAFSNCDPNPCPQPTGACCFDDGSCQPLTQAACLEAGGSFQGPFTTCDPNPCPQPKGACCLADGTCTVVTAADCELFGGDFQGNFQGCDPNPCPQPTGACCFSDGTCEVLTQADCRAAGADPTGLIVRASKEFVEPFFNSYTVQKTVTVCVDPECGAGPLGLGQADTPCDPFPDDGLVTYTYELVNDVDSMNPVIGFVIDTGVPGAILEAGFLGRGGVQPSKVIVDEAGTRVEWSFFVDSLDPGEFSDGLYIISALAPAEVDATMLGDFALDTIGTCLGPAIEADICIGSVWQGPGTDCATVDCPQPAGACCFPDGSCTIVTEERCESDGGSYQGDFSTCDPNPCPPPPGACCFDDGSCAVMTQDECQSAGGLWQGAGSDCQSVECPQPTGACCFENGFCTTVTAER